MSPLVHRLPADLIAEIADAVRSGRPGGDAWMRRAVDAVRAAEPAACLGHFGSEAAWLTSRAAMAAKLPAYAVDAETAAAVLGSLTGRPMLAAAYAGSLTDWPCGLAKLVSLCRERIDGSGPRRLTGKTLTPSAERVAMSLEAATLVRRFEGQTPAVIAHFARQCEAGRWRTSTLDALSPAVAGLGRALIDARREALAGRSFRISKPHAAASPHHHVERPSDALACGSPDLHGEWGESAWRLADAGEAEPSSAAGIGLRPHMQVGRPAPQRPQIPALSGEAVVPPPKLRGPLGGRRQKAAAR